MKLGNVIIRSVKEFYVVLILRRNLKMAVETKNSIVERTVEAFDCLHFIDGKFVRISR